MMDADYIVITCNNCQKWFKYSNYSPQEIQLIPLIWPLAKWGMDIVGPLPPLQGNYRYAAVAVEYFSKWVEAKPLQAITFPTLQKFFLAKYYLPLRRPKRADSGQWQTV
jgi:hypothetical protein